MKKKDFYNLVWKNLAEFKRLGCHVTVKYIMKEENCSRQGSGAVHQDGPPARAADAADRHRLRLPRPQPRRARGPAPAQVLAERYGINTAMGFTGAKFTPEMDVEGKVYADLRPSIVDWLYDHGRRTYRATREGYLRTRAFFGKLAGRAPGGGSGRQSKQTE